MQLDSGRYSQPRTLAAVGTSPATETQELPATVLMQERRILDLLAQALDMDDAGRKAFLDRVCANDREGRAEIEAMLFAESNLAGDFMEEPAFAPFLPRYGT